MRLKIRHWVAVLDIPGLTDNEQVAQMYDEEKMESFERFVRRYIEDKPTMDYILTCLKDFLKSLELNDGNLNARIDFGVGYILICYHTAELEFVSEKFFDGGNNVYHN